MTVWDLKRILEALPPEMDLLEVSVYHEVDGEPEVSTPKAFLAWETAFGYVKYPEGDEQLRLFIVPKEMES